MSNINVSSLFVPYEKYNLKQQLSRKDNLGNKIIYLQDICYLDKKQFKFFLENPIEIDFFCFEKLNDYNQNLLIKKFQSEPKFMSIFNQNSFENFLSLLTSDNSLIAIFFKDKISELNYWKDNIIIDIQSEIDKRYYFKQLWNFILLNHSFSYQQYCFEHVLYFKLFLLNVLLNNNYKLHTSDYKQLILSLENDLNYYRDIEYNKIELNHNNNLIIQYCYDLIEDFNCDFNDKFLFYEFLNCDVLASRHNSNYYRIGIFYDILDDEIETAINKLMKRRAYHCIIYCSTLEYQHLNIENLDDILNELVEKFVYLRIIFKDRLHIEFRSENPLYEKREERYKDKIANDYSIYKYMISKLTELINSKFKLLNSELKADIKNEIFNCEYGVCDYIQLYKPEDQKEIGKLDAFIVDKQSHYYKNYMNHLNDIKEHHVYLNLI